MIKVNSIFYLFILFIIFLYTAQAGITEDSTIVNSNTSPPKISSPDDRIIEHNTLAKIIWKIIEDNPNEYWVLINDKQIVSPCGYQDNEEITVDINTSMLGSDSYTIFATDSSWNMARDEVNVTIANSSAPVITGPEDIEVEMDGTASIDWTIVDFDPDTYQVYLDDEIFTDTTSYDSNQEITVTVETDKVGTFSYVIHAIDKSGNKASDEVLATVRDSSAPVITGPEDIEVEMDGTASIDWTIVDLDPDTYQVYLDDEIFIDTTSYDSSQEITVTVETDKTGTFSYVIHAIDKSGNKASDEVLVTVKDNSAPIITGPEDIEVDMNGTASIDWTISDSDPDTYQVYLDDDIFKDTTSYDSGQTITVTVETDTAGIFNYTILAIDKSGNEASDKVLVTVKDNSAPVITGPDDMEVDLNKTASIDWTISDSDPDTYQVYLDDTIFIDTTSYDSDQKITVPIETNKTGIFTYTIHCH